MLGDALLSFCAFLPFAFILLALLQSPRLHKQLSVRWSNGSDIISHTISAPAL